MWDREARAGLIAAPSLVDAGGRINVRFGYGLDLMGGVGTSWAGIGLSGQDRVYRLGYEFQAHRRTTTTADVRVALEATRREGAAGGGPQHGLTLNSTVSW